MGCGGETDRCRCKFRRRISVMYNFHAEPLDSSETKQRRRIYENRICVHN